MIGSIHTLQIDEMGHVIMPANLEAEWSTYLLEVEIEDGELIVRAVSR